VAEAAVSTPGNTADTAEELADIQGLVRFGFKHHTEAVFVLLRVKDVVAARHWLGQAQPTSAVSIDPVPATALQIALTRAGMNALGVAADVVGGFSEEFLEGMAGDTNRTRRLGDVEANAPDRWDWGSGDREPHVAVLLYALPGHLAPLQQTTELSCAAGFDVMYRLTTTDMGGVEPFGFADGLSQPLIDWGRKLPAADERQPSYRNLICLGEFILGYPNEYGLYTPRPLLDAGRDPRGLLPHAEDSPQSPDLGRNGTYLVIRQLRQDVRGFWQAMDALAGGVDVEREWLASRLVGRTRSGEPIVVEQPRALAAAEAGAATGLDTLATAEAQAATDLGELAAGALATTTAPDLNAFTFDSDPAGNRCPIGAHIRRTNPRTADLPPGGPGTVSQLIRTLGLAAKARAQDLAAASRFHRVLRRGREYGVQVTPEQALRLPAAVESGLHFVCLNANIQRQFEFVQSAWIMSTKFNGLHEESDPLLGNRMPSPAGTRCDYFSMPRTAGPTRRLEKLPQFVTVAGGAYFFLPGIRALRWLASAGAG
jgi:deferrochelatase/peroxidase EfeB